MGPKKKATGPTTRSRSGKAAKVEKDGLASEVVVEEKKEENVVDAKPQLDVSPGRNQSHDGGSAKKVRSILKRRSRPSDAKNNPTVRAARRISQNARRFSSVRMNSPGEERMTLVFYRVPNEQPNGRQSFIWSKVPEKKKAANELKQFRFRVRESILEIPCLPDKIPGIVRMPKDDPESEEGAAEPEKKPNTRGRKKAQATKKKTTTTRGRKKDPVKPPSPVPEEPMESGDEIAEKTGDDLAAAEPKKRTSDVAFLAKGTPLRPPTFETVTNVGHRKERPRVVPPLVEIRPQPVASAETLDLPTPLFEMDNIMFGDEEPEESPQMEQASNRTSTTVPPRVRRRSFIEAGEKMKEQQKSRFRVPSISQDDEITGTRRRRYSVSSRKLQKNSLIDMTASQTKPLIKAGPVLDCNDDELVQFWSRFKANPDLGYPKDFPGVEILEAFRLRTLEAENSKEHVTLPWTEIYRPRSASEFIGNEASVDGVLTWLTKWKKRLQRQEALVLKAKQTATKKRSYRDDEDWTEEEDIDAKLSNLAFIRGVTGVGKTCLVHALAQELGFQVIEMNCSSLRNQKQILSSLEGATQNHRLNLKTLPPTKKTSRAAAATAAEPSTSAHGIQKYFAPAPKKRNGRKTPPAEPMPLEVITIDDDADVRPTKSGKVVPENNNTERPMSVILFDDVDVLFEADERFWQGLREIAQNAMVPILMTCKDYDLPRFPLNDLTVESFQLNPLNQDIPARYYRLLLLSRRIILENEADYIRYCRQFNGDLRSCLTGLQFWLDNRSTAKPAKARRRPKTPPVIAQPLIAGESMDVDKDDNGFDWLKYEMGCIQDQYSGMPVLKWPSRILDGLKDTRSIGSVKDDTLEIERPPDTTKDRFTSFFNGLMERPQFADDESPSTSSYQDPQQIRAFHEVTSEICPMSAMNTFHRDSFVVDYLPALRHMAAAGKEAKSVGSRRRRGRCYLHNIGLDDRSGLVQSMLEENPFRETGGGQD